MIAIEPRLELLRRRGLSPWHRVWLAAGLYALVMAVLGIDRYATYHSGEDLGVFVQAIADAAGGMRDQGEQGSHFSHHFSPVLYLCAPLLLLMRSPLALVILQACAGALTAPAIFLFARRRSNERLAFAAGLVALLYPPLVGVTFTDFHENGFVPAAIAWLVYAVDCRRFWIALGLAVLALSIKEDQAVILGLLGIGYAAWSLARKDRVAALFGASVTVLASGVLFLFFEVLLPANGVSHWFVLGYYATDIHGKVPVWQGVVGRLTYLAEALVPLLLLPLRSPLALLALPGFVEVLSSRWPITYTMGQHYAAVWIPYLLVAFAAALAAIACHHAARARTLAAWCVGLCILVDVIASPAHWGHYLGLPNEHDTARDRVLSLIPPKASAGSVDEIFVHMALNPQARTGYNGGLDYLVVDGRYDSEGWRTVYLPQLRRALASGKYEAAAHIDDVTLYRQTRNKTSPAPSER